MPLIDFAFHLSFSALWMTSCISKTLGPEKISARGLFRCASLNSALSVHVRKDGHTAGVGVLAFYIILVVPRLTGSAARPSARPSAGSRPRLTV